MNQQDTEKFETALTQEVIKSNDLIQKSRFDLSLQQQKIVLYLISKIKPEDKKFQNYQFSIKEFCQVCGIDYKNGANYITVKNQIQKIADKSMWVKIENGTKDVLVRWIQKAVIEENKGTITVRLDEDLKPYLLQLKSNYTSYEFIYILKLKSKYSIRLYEFIQSIHYNTLKPYTNTYDLSYLKKVLGAENYTDYSKFRQRIFDKSVNEINEKTDKYISYEPIKQGSKVIAIKFTVSTKEILERATIQANIYKSLKGANEEPQEQNAEQIVMQGFEPEPEIIVPTVPEPEVQEIEVQTVPEPEIKEPEVQEEPPEEPEVKELEVQTKEKETKQNSVSRFFKKLFKK